MDSSLKSPSLFRLCASLLYEALSLIAIVFVCAALFVWVAGDATHGIKRLLLQLFLWSCVGVYYLSCWVKSGQTLAMQAWKLRLMNRGGRLITLREAFPRYLLATLSMVFLGLGFLWAIVDKKNLYLHDRWLKLQIVYTE